MAALALHAEMNELNARRRAEGKREFRMRMLISQATFEGLGGRLATHRI